MWGILPIQKSLHIFGSLNGLSYHNFCRDFCRKKCRKREGGRQTEAANTCLIILVFGTCGILSHRPTPEVGPWELSVGGGYFWPSLAHPGLGARTPQPR